MRLVVNLIVCFLCLSSYVFSQTQDTLKQKKTKVYLEHANTLSFDKEVMADAQVLNGIS